MNTLTIPKYRTLHNQLNQLIDTANELEQLREDERHDLLDDLYAGRYTEILNLVNYTINTIIEEQEIAQKADRIDN